MRKALAKTISAICLLMVITNHSLAQQTGNSSFNYPGGLVEFILPKNSSILPIVQFGIHEPVIIDQIDHWRVVVGLAVNTLPGDYLLYVKHLDSTSPAYNIKFTVKHKDYPIDTIGSETTPAINLTHKSFSDLDFSNSEQPELPLRKPIKGDWDDLFAYKKYNTDKNLKAPILTTQNYISPKSTESRIVIAPAKAIISKIELNNDPSQLATVFLDHGRGLYSIIFGISDLSVTLGDGVVAGSVIGKLPSSAIPSELKWQSLINGVYINPLILTKI